MIEFDPEMIALLRNTTPNKIAEDLVSVQPMPDTIISDLINNAMSEEELIKEGYKPIDSLTKLLWIKK